MGITKEELKKLRDLKQSLESKRESEKGETWESLKRYVLPELLEPSERAKSRHYSTTAQRYTTLASNALQGWAYGRTISWLNIEREVHDSDDNESTKEERQWLQDCRQIMLDDLSRADFYDESLGFTQVVLNLSTGIMLLDWDEANDSFVCENIAPDRCVIAQDKFHHVNLCMYTFQLSKDQAEDMFGDDCPDKIKNSHSYEQDYTFVKAMVSAEKYDIEVNGEGDWIEVIWSEDDRDKALVERRTQHKPFICWRFERSLTGSPWGCNSPGERCLADIISLNVMEKAKTKGIQLRLDPPIKATEGLALNIVPAGVTRVKGSQDYAYMAPPGSSEEVLLEIQRKEANLKEAYYVDFFLMLQQTLEKNKTATEATLLADEKSQIMASFTSRLNNEFLEPILETLWDMEIRHGRFPTPPESLQGEDVRIDYVSPLAIAQRKAQIYVPARQFIAETLTFSELDSSVKYLFRIPEYATAMAKDMMIDERFLNSKEEIEAKVQEEQELAMKQLELQNNQNQAKTDAQVYSALSKAPEQGSAVSQLTGGVSNGK